MCARVCTIVVGQKSLWETFSADCNLFREHQPSVTVSLRGKQRLCSNIQTHCVPNSPRNYCWRGNESFTALSADSRHTAGPQTWSEWCCTSPDSSLFLTLFTLFLCLQRQPLEDHFLVCRCGVASQSDSMRNMRVASILLSNSRQGARCQTISLANGVLKSWQTQSAPVPSHI